MYVCISYLVALLYCVIYMQTRHTVAPTCSHSMHMVQCAMANVDRLLQHFVIIFIITHAAQYTEYLQQHSSMTQHAQKKVV